jgi:hypothetical protein
MTFDLVLLYYDNPKLLSNWFKRLLEHSDYLKFAKNRSKIIIADSGTPLDKIEESLKLFATIKLYAQTILGIDVVYLRADTDELRKQVPPEIDARPACHAYNMAIDYSNAEIIYTSVIGQIFSPKYFEKTLLLHIKDEKAVVLPQRFDLDHPEYHESHFSDSWTDVLNKGKLNPSGGWPDMSVRRKWLNEVGGYDENYITIAPVDMDMGSRLTGKLDDGTPSERLFPGKQAYINLGLNIYKPFDPFTIMSLTCNQYKGHAATESPRRQLGYQKGIEYYLQMWGKIKRNENRIPIKYKEY